MDGERDPNKLAVMRHRRCKKDDEEIAKALTGAWREEHLFVLAQSLELYDFYTEKISVCDTQIEQNYGAIRPNWSNPEPARQMAMEYFSPKRLAKNAPKDGVQIRVHLKRICGVDLVAVQGIGVLLPKRALPKSEPI